MDIYQFSHEYTYRSDPKLAKLGWLNFMQEKLIPTYEYIFSFF